MCMPLYLSNVLSSHLSSARRHTHRVGLWCDGRNGGIRAAALGYSNSRWYCRRPCWCLLLGISRRISTGVRTCAPSLKATKQRVQRVLPTSVQMREKEEEVERRGERRRSRPGETAIESKNKLGRRSECLCNLYSFFSLWHTVDDSTQFACWLAQHLTLLEFARLSF